MWYLRGREDMLYKNGYTTRKSFICDGKKLHIERKIVTTDTFVAF